MKHTSYLVGIGVRDYTTFNESAGLLSKLMRRAMLDKLRIRHLLTQGI